MADKVKLTKGKKEMVLLAIFAGMNGESDVSDSKWSWLNWFCNDEEQTGGADTFNRCIEKGWLTYSHDSDFDTGIARITPLGLSLIGGGE